MSGNIMIDGCQNCHQSKMHHMPDGACLFEPTRYKAFPSVVWHPQATNDRPHVQMPLEPSWWRKCWAAFFTNPFH